MRNIIAEKIKVCRILFSIMILIFSTNVFSSTASKKVNLIPAKHCSDLICVRNNIDLIDADIVRLIGLRLMYVERAGELKKGKMATHDQARENQIILKVTKLAEKEGYESSIIIEVYKTLLTQTNIYEKKIADGSLAI